MSTDREIDAHSGTQTTGHEWDGIKELDTPLPRWWLIIFYASIAIAVVMWVLYPAWPGITGYTPGVLGHSDRVNVAKDLAGLQADRAEMAHALITIPPEHAAADPTLSRFAMAAGEAAFGDNCATCHGAGGRGAKGYPTLADDVWLWGGTLGDIEKTIKVGARADHPDTRLSQMPAFGQGLLTPAQISDITEFTLSLSGREHNARAAARAAPLFAQHCVSCHAIDGGGLRQFGAPSLRDQVWLNGDKRADIRTQIVTGRGGVMPAWEGRLDATTVRALAIYVHSLGGGEAAPAAAPQPLVEPAANAELPMEAVPR